MKKISTLLILFYSSVLLAAQNPDPNWANHCQQVASDPAIFLKKLASFENKLTFTNHGGLFNGGVCWWHSRLTRIFQYLAVFDPTAARPTDDEAYRLVKRLRDGKATTIPGFRNVADFSNSHYNAIQQNLEAWQISNGGFGFGFLDGLNGSTAVESDELKKMMDETYTDFVQNQKPIYQVLQLPGVTAHAWLVINMAPMANGYQFEVVDSNYGSNQVWTFRQGDKGFYYRGSPFVNYTTRRGKAEEELLSKRLAEMCLSVNSNLKYIEPTTTLDDELNALFQKQ